MAGETWSVDDAYAGGAESRPYDPGERAASAVANLTSLSKELSRPDMTPEKRAILEPELLREQQRYEKGQTETGTTFGLNEAYGDPFGKHQSDAQIALGGVGAASQAVAGEVGSLADMVVGLPGMAMGSFMEGARRVQGFLSGENRDEVAKSARATYHQWADAAPQPVSKFVSLFAGKDQAPDGTAVSNAMGYVLGLTDRDAASLEERTGGFIKQEDYQMARDALMGIFGTKATAKGLARPVEAAAQRLFGVPPESADAMAGASDFRKPPAPPPEARPTPASTAKADIEATLGIQDPVAQAKAQKARQAQARAAFKEDPKYADYLQNYANEEARMREEGALRGQADAAAEAADKAAPSRIGSAEPVLLDEAGKPIPQSSLDSALDKANKGTPFLMTAEERIALSKAASKWVQRDVQQPFNRGSGAIDQNLLNILAVGGAGAALAYAYPDEGKAGLAALAGGAFLLGDAGKIAGHADKAPLSVLLKDSATTLKTLERPEFQNKWLLGLDEVEQSLNREGVGKAEKDIIGEVVRQQREQGHDSITAKDLLLGVKAATQDFELRERPVDTYANYGLDKIDRSVKLPEDSVSIPGAEKAEFGQPPAKTSIWQLPFDVSDANHFSDPRYFGHTRSFEEGGVKHVVEVQSDLVQKAGKVLSEEERTTLQSAISEAKAIDAQLRKSEVVGLYVDDPTWSAKFRKSLAAWPDKVRELVQDRLKSISGSDLTDALKVSEQRDGAGKRIRRDLNRAVGEVQEHIGVKLAEDEAKYRASAGGAAATPIFKDWYKRLIREELAASVRERAAGLPPEVQKTISYVENRLRNYPPDNQVKQYHQAKIDAAKIKLAAPAIVRFATADTVAKVEGWPDRRQALADSIETSLENLDRARRGEYNATGFSPAETAKYIEAEIAKKTAEQKALSGRFAAEHQSIYDRYRRDIEKFLRQLGGTPYTDSAGHTWIEVPTQPGMARAQMFGKADPYLLARIAATGAGLALGTTLDKDNPILGGLIGVVSGAFLATGGARKIGAAIKALGKVDPSIRVDDLGNAHSYAIARARTEGQRLFNSIVDLVPKPERRAAISHAIEKGTVSSLPAKEQQAARLFMEMAEGIKAQAFDSGVLDSAVENYVTHLWDLTPKQLDAFQQMMAKSPSGPSMSPGNRFALRRSIPTIEQGKAMGFRPRTEDIAAIGELYLNSMARSMANKGLIEGLKAARTEDGVGLFVKAKDAPTSFVAINHPQLRPYRVHPELEDSLRFMFAQTDTPGLLRAAEALNTAIKRMNVSFSLFHAKALFDAALAATANPLLAVREIAQAAAPRIFGENKYLKEIRERGVGPIIDMALKGGLQFSLERAGSAVEEVSAGFYDGMRGLAKMMDDAVPHAGAPVRAFAAANHAFDNFTWGRLHAGLKLSVFAKTYEKLLKNNPALPREEAAGIAAQYTNRLFGGLDWRREANAFKSKFGHSLANTLMNPAARRFERFLMFAPDWTYSTTVAFTDAFRRGSGIKGIFKPTTLTDLHRQYLIRSGIYYYVIGNALNNAFTGHPLGQDQNGKSVDPTFIQLGDGRKMQWSKHTMEPIHWMQHPVQQAINKLGYIPREGLSQAFGVEYVAPHTDKQDNVSAGPKMREGRLAHALKGVSPIGLGQFDRGAEVGAMGMLGMPIYGETKEQREVRLRRQRLDRLMQKETH